MSGDVDALSGVRITQAAFYERLIERQWCRLRLSAAPRSFVAKICWEDTYAIGVQPASAEVLTALGHKDSLHAETLGALGMYAGQTCLVMKKALVAVTPLPGGKFNAGARGSSRD